MNAQVKERLGIPKPLYVKVQEIKAYTGWTANELRRARMYGWVEMKRIPSKVKGRKTQIVYNLNSVDEKLIKKGPATRQAQTVN